MTNCAEDHRGCQWQGRAWNLHDSSSLLLSEIGMFPWNFSIVMIQSFPRRESTAEPVSCTIQVEMLDPDAQMPRQLSQEDPGKEDWNPRRIQLGAAGRNKCSGLPENK